jgi:hypothetical protein
MHSGTIYCGYLALALATGASAVAETVYVDQRNGSTNASPYKTIQLAISDPNATEVVIFPGVYRENIYISRNIRLIGYDGPNTTVIDGSSAGTVISIDRGFNVTIEGLKITSGSIGISQPTAGTLRVKNCVICGNTAHGIHVSRTESGNAPTVYIDNCVFIANSADGLYMAGVNIGGATSGASWIPVIRLFNCVFVGNGSFGLNSNFTDWHYGRLGGGSFTIDLNDFSNNGAGSYNTALFGPGQEISVGTAYTFTPEFVGGSSTSCNQDFRLVQASQCRDAGQVGIGWLDPDGTRNDLGAFGGPGAQRFYTNPNDGPVVREVTIDQGFVPRGSTFTVRAKGAVRDGQ